MKLFFLANEIVISRIICRRVGIWIDFYAVFVVLKWVEHRTARLGKTADVMFYSIKTYEIELELLNVIW